MKCIHKKCVEYCGGEFFGSNINNELCKSNVCFMIIGLKENVPYFVKVAPVTFLNSELLKDELLNCLELLITGRFNMRADICDNHAANVSAFTKLILQFGEDNESLFINFQWKSINKRFIYFTTPSILSKMLEITCLAKNGLYFSNSAFLSLMMML